MAGIQTWNGIQILMNLLEKWPSAWEGYSKHDILKVQ
jgi:hypothetical protein